MIKDAASGRLAGEARLNATLLREFAILARGASLAGLSSLTRRERQVALAIVDGLTNKEIAQQLYISLPTVKSHVHCILRKLGVARRDDVLSRLQDTAAV
jgi:DNA-binding NarL/FixJ family response regulator